MVRAALKIAINSLMAAWVPGTARGSCAMDPGFAQVAQSAPIVAVVRVVALPPGASGLTVSSPAECADLRVLDVRKGPHLAPTIRVWDAALNTPDGGGLAGLRVGMDVVFAMFPVKDVNARRRDGIPALDPVDAPAEDYLIWGCVKYWKERRASRLGR